MIKQVNGSEGAGPQLQLVVIGTNVFGEVARANESRITRSALQAG